eukprot:Pompholyxophrys_punicea_v1_NODE_118_length_3370_cov_2.781900.p4 type:complete len:130 gc:universal NODE_118_length_3370_cov_2.781900:1422-1811(+)
MDLRFSLCTTTGKCSDLFFRMVLILLWKKRLYRVRNFWMRTWQHVARFFLTTSTASSPASVRIMFCLPSINWILGVALVKLIKDFYLICVLDWGLIALETSCLCTTQDNCINSWTCFLSMAICATLFLF